MKPKGIDSHLYFAQMMVALRPAVARGSPQGCCI